MIKQGEGNGTHLEMRKATLFSVAQIGELRETAFGTNMISFHTNWQIPIVYLKQNVLTSTLQRMKVVLKLGDFYLEESNI